MKNRIIYYFSGSGNSLYVARQIAAETNSGLLPLKIISEGNDPCLEYDVIGFVFPVYDFKAPDFVIDCIRSIRINSDAYIFCAATYGLSAGKTIERFAERLAENDLKLKAGFSIAMPHNGICSAKAPEQIMLQRLEAAPERISDFSERINKKEVFVEPGQLVATGMIKSGALRTLPGLLKFLFILIFRGADSLAYRVDDNCIGCGRCERLCPVNNIKITDGRPEWGDHCANCFGCLNWCPQKAISLGGWDMYIQHYHHPEIKIEDMSI